MTKKALTGRSLKKIGPRIVRAWFDTVINPLLHSLEMEQALLAEKNWTWRFRPASLESLHPVRSHIDPEARDNLEQFVEFHPDVRKAIEEHDKKVSILLEECKMLQHALEESSSLHGIYRNIASPQALREIGVTALADLFGAYPAADHLALLAQYIVNNTGDLPGFYYTARLWNRHKGELMAILKHPSLQTHQKTVMKAGRALLRSVDHLILLLKEIRLQLSLEHDVPYVVTGKKSAESAGEGF